MSRDMELGALLASIWIVLLWASYSLYRIADALEDRNDKEE